MSGRYQEPFPLRRMVGHPVFWGVLATCVVAAIVIWWGVQEDCGLTGSCETRFRQVLGSKPAEIGTVVSGVALVLVWVWLVVIAWILGRVAKLMRMELESRERGET